MFAIEILNLTDFNHNSCPMVNLTIDQCDGGNAIVNTTYEPANDDKCREQRLATSTWYKSLEENERQRNRLY